MLVVHVEIQVKPEYIEEFIAATIANAAESRKEPGVAQFDLLRKELEPGSFLLVEAYRDSLAPARHKESAHYQLWAQTVAPFMAKARQSTKYDRV